MKVDVAIVGGGPAGSTVGCLLKKYEPGIEVLILERERFPRDHVGESQLPFVSHVLDEMGCWDPVEKAGFPVKVGATYCWGKSKDLWDFDFARPEQYEDLRRPGRFAGVRRNLAFQVDRAIYDEILLRRAAELGCDVRQETQVRAISVQEDRVSCLEAEGIGKVQADVYVDASGHAGILRRAAGVEVDCPTNLRNVAVWRYWRNAEWAEEIGVGGTRVQVMSVGYGWIWFIPLGPDRTSVGLVLPAAYFKSSGQTLPQLYAAALQEQPRIAALMQSATSEEETYTTKDWSFIAKRMCGTNWYLVGESSGFADPILAAGLTIAHAAGREAAFSILEERRGADPSWLKECYERGQFRRLRSHIRFADYWYTANAQFSDLKDYTAEIAREAGLSLSPDEAWQWLGQGGFIDETLAAGLGATQLTLIRQLGDFMGETDPRLVVSRTNSFRLVLDGAAEEVRASYEAGRATPVKCLVRDGKVWPLAGRYAPWRTWLASPISVSDLTLELRCQAERDCPLDQGGEIFQLLAALEALIADGWVAATLDPSQPLIGKIHLSNLRWHDERTPTSAGAQER